MTLLIQMICWVLSCCLMLWAPRVTLIEVLRELRGKGSHRRNGPGAVSYTHLTLPTIA